MADKVERIKRELSYEGKLVKFYTDTVRLSNGNVAQWDYIQHIGAAAVVPVLDDGRLMMVRQYRNALDRFTIEVPAGGLDYVGEPMVECAARELEEETGYLAGEMEFLISLKTTVAFCNEQIDIFVARNLTKTKQKLDEDESIDIQAYTVEELCELIFKGEIQDSKTLSAILAYRQKYYKE